MFLHVRQIKFFTFLTYHSNRKVEVGFYCLFVCFFCSSYQPLSPSNAFSQKYFPIFALVMALVNMHGSRFMAGIKQNLVKYSLNVIGCAVGFTFPFGFLILRIFQFLSIHEQVVSILFHVHFPSFHTFSFSLSSSHIFVLVSKQKPKLGYDFIHVSTRAKSFCRPQISFGDFWSQ